MVEDHWEPASKSIVIKRTKTFLWVSWRASTTRFAKSREEPTVYEEYLRLKILSCMLPKI